MTEPMSDALFGVDGTELPRLSRDPTGRGSWGDGSVVPPPMPLPAIPNLNMTREAIAAALGEDPGGPGYHERAAAAAASPPVAAGSAATGSSATGSSATGSSATQAAATAPPASGVASRQPASATTMPVSLPQAPQRGPSFIRSAPTISLPRVRLRTSRRGAAPFTRGLPTQTRSNGGAGVFFTISVIVFAVLLYFIVSGIVESFARLIPF